MTAQLPSEVRNAILRTGELYEVGGSVRDMKLGVPLLDRDYLVRGIAMKDLVALLRPFGHADWVGRSFGVIKFTFTGDGPEQASTVDIALPRRERSTGTGHREFEVDYDPELSLEDDLKRRDFTVNAMAVNMRDGSLIDPFGGQEDLSQLNLKLIFPEAFSEDPLRMLRAMGLVARFDFSLDPELRDRLANDYPLLRDVSAERIAEEFNKILLRAATPSTALRLMESIGMLDVLLPELRPAVGCDQPGPYHKYDVFEHSCRTVDAAPQRLALRWAALLHDVEKPATKHVTANKVTFYNHEVLGARTATNVLNRLRYGRDMIEHVAVLIERHLFNTDMGDKGLRRLIRRVTPDRMPDLFDLRRADVIGMGMGEHADDVDALELRFRAEIDANSPLCRADLAVDGRVLMTELNIAPGKELGKVIDYLLERVLDEPMKNEKSVLVALARKYLDRGAVLAASAIFGTLTYLGGFGG